jgi:tetratricopeptide (TPR) repeat protein
MNNLAALYRTEGRYVDAEPLVIQVLAVRRRVLGEEHRETLITRSNLARLYQDQRLFARAEPLFASILEIRRRTLGPEHPDTLNSMNSLARVYLDQKQFAQAQPLFVKVLEARRRVLGARHPDTLDTLVRLASLYLGQRESAQAEPLLREALQAQEQADPDSWQCSETRSLLGASLAGQARFSEAEPLLLAGYQGLVRWKDTLPWENRSAPQQAADRILRLYRDWQNPDKVAEWREKLAPSFVAERRP